VTSDRALAGELYSMGVTALKPMKFVAMLASLIQIISNEVPVLQSTETDTAMTPKEAEKKEKAASKKVLEDWCFQFVPRDVEETDRKGKRRCRDRIPAQESEEMGVDEPNQSQEKTDSMDLSSFSGLKLDG